MSYNNIKNNLIFKRKVKEKINKIILNILAFKSNMIFYELFYKKQKIHKIKKTNRELNCF